MKKSSLTKLYLVVLTLPKNKIEVMYDTLQSFEVTSYVSTLAKGVNDTDFTKALMFFVIKENLIKDAFLKIEDRFNSFKGKISMCYAIPLDSIIGVSNYMALSNGGKK